MAKTGEFPGGHEHDSSLEQSVLDIFIEARRVYKSGGERFTVFSKTNPWDDKLKQAVSELQPEHLTRLIGGGDVNTFDDPTFVLIAEKWSAEASARRLYEMAYSAYTKDQNQAVRSLLAGQRITVQKREGARRSAISYSDGQYETIGPSPDSVSGTFFDVNVHVGELVLTADEPNEDIKFWHADLLDITTSEQLLDLRIDK